MQEQKRLKILFIINPVSGVKEKSDWENKIREYFKESAHVTEFYLLTGKNDKASIQYHIEITQPDRVVAVGGDGTLKLVAELVKDKKITLGLIPAGSANGMAKELGIPLDINAALDISINEEPHPIDIIRINEKEFCIHLSDIGLNAMLVKYFDQSDRRGMWGYGKALYRVLWKKQKIYATIITDEGEFKRKAFMVVIANARKYGTGGNINPNGEIDDGKFEIVVLRKLNLIEIMKALLTDKSFDPKKIEVFSTTKAEIRTIKRTYFQVDGEYRSKIDHIKAEIVAKALQIAHPVENELKMK